LVLTFECFTALPQLYQTLPALDNTFIPESRVLGHPHRQSNFITAPDGDPLSDPAACLANASAGGLLFSGSAWPHMRKMTWATWNRYAPLAESLEQCLNCVQTFYFDYNVASQAVAVPVTSKNRS
jgi:hypothetical protein